MSRVHGQVGWLALSAILTACDGRPGLLGEYVVAVGAKHKAAPDADAGTTPPDGESAAAPSTLATDAVTSPDASSLTSTPSTEDNATPTPSQPNAPPSSQPVRAPDLIGVGATPNPVPPNYEGYLCSAIGLTFAEDTWVTAIEVSPQHADYALRASVNVSARIGET